MPYGSVILGTMKNNICTGSSIVLITKETFCYLLYPSSPLAYFHGSWTFPWEYLWDRGV